MTIGERIKSLRKKNDMTQEKLADFLCVSYQAVSKWECGASNPDLSLIVPLAKLLHVTTDELLGMVEPETDEKKLEYDALYEKAHHPEQLKLAEQASREYPGELKYIMWQASCTYMSAYDNYTTQEVFYETLEKALKLCFIVFENTTDENLKNTALENIVMNLAALRRNDEAKRYAEMYPNNLILDKDTVMGWALTGEDKRKHSQQMLMNHLDGMLRVLIASDNPDPKKLEFLECAEKLIHDMFPAEEYNRYYDDLIDIVIHKALIYSNTDHKKAIWELKKARTYAETFDDLFMCTPTAVSYNSPYFDLLDYNSADLLVYGPLEENKRINNFKWWLSGRCFDAIKEQDDFRELMNN
ncbi:MAG: helix-turn-helix transcriptional regulator [Ruminococcaceae bacterium]|nr:helix-turn-helix transcriptional regulator [Oscillospiraceae bacterium]